MAPGSCVVYVDREGDSHNALVLHVWDTSLNIVYVDKNKPTNQAGEKYGHARIIETSVPFYEEGMSGFYIEREKIVIADEAPFPKTAPDPGESKDGLSKEAPTEPPTPAKDEDLLKEEASDDITEPADAPPSQDEIETVDIPEDGPVVDPDNADQGQLNETERPPDGEPVVATGTGLGATGVGVETGTVTGSDMTDEEEKPTS